MSGDCFFLQPLLSPTYTYYYLLCRYTNCYVFDYPNGISWRGVRGDEELKLKSRVQKERFAECVGNFGHTYNMIFVLPKECGSGPTEPNCTESGLLTAHRARRLFNAAIKITSNLLIAITAETRQSESSWSAARLVISIKCTGNVSRCPITRY